MKWIKDKPRLENEWYWYRTNKNSLPFPVFVCSDGMIEVEGMAQHLDQTKGEWSHCPISYPDEE